MKALGKAKPLPPGSRSDNKAVLVLLGLSGAGKTTTFNFLFNLNDQISDSSSATSTIREYNAAVEYNGIEYDLRIFDTPGFGDSRKQLDRDARFVASFDQLLRTHEVLQSCYPTMVLLVVKFHDDRIDGETSNFIQMLKAIDSLLANFRLIDKCPQYPNLVFVLTHIMSEDNESLRKNPTPKIKLIESLVKTFTNIPIPIHAVVAENKPDLYNLPKQNGWYKLPNGQFYPHNLYTKITSMAGQAPINAGSKILHEAFVNPAKISVKLLNETELLSEGSLAVNDAKTILQSAKFHIENTQMSREIKKRWDKLDEPFRRPYFSALQITQSTFHRHKIFGENDLPTTREAVLKLLMDLPLNPPIFKVLEGLGVVAPELPNSLKIGSFYNIFADCTMASSPFDLDTTGYTNIGFRAPHWVDAEVVSEILHLTSEYATISDYHKDRLAQLNIIDNFKLEHFKSEPKEGYNVIPPKAQGQVTKLTGVRETRVFRIRSIQPVLSHAFRDAVRTLPHEFNPTDAENWRAFFNANGTHVVKSVFAGGCVEVVALKKQNEVSQRKTSPEAVMSIIKDILSNVGILMPMDLNARAEDWEFKIYFRGGNQALAYPNLENIFTFQGVKFVKQWTASLHAYPEMLHSEIGLQPISEYLKRVNPSAAKEMRLAMSHFFLPQTEAAVGKAAAGNNLSRTSSSTSINPPERIKVPEPPPPQGGWVWWLKKKLQARNNN